MSAELIGKLLAKAERTDNPHEAEAFTRKAEALMVKLGIDEAVARAAAGDAVAPERIVETRVSLFVDDRRTWTPTPDRPSVTCVGCRQDLPARRFPTTKIPGERGVECRTCRDKRIETATPLTVESNRYNRTHIDGFFRVVRGMGARGYYSGEHTFYIVAFQSDAERLALLLPSLKAQSMMAMWTWWKLEGDYASRWGTETDRYNARRDFLFSFYGAVASRLRRETKRVVDSTPGAALAVRDKTTEVNDFLDAMNLSKGRGVNYGGSAAGHDAGTRANLGGNAVGGGRTAIG